MKKITGFLLLLQATAICPAYAGDGAQNASRAAEQALPPSDRPASLLNTTTQPISLQTETGIEIGGEISDYRYQEHVAAGQDFMHETGAKLGLLASGTRAFGNGYFLKGDFRFAYSSNNYASPTSGKLDNVPDYLWDTRILAGKDFLLNAIPLGKGAFNLDISPYAGFGYRNLFNDSRGTTNLGSHGYRRDSEYYYLPIGITTRFRVMNDARISPNIEYDQLVFGRQTSYQNDAGTFFPNNANDQYGGYGLRGSIMVETSSWSLGPFFEYWNINQSDPTSFVSSPMRWTITEPHNQTLEYGMQALYRFGTPRSDKTDVASSGLIARPSAPVSLATETGIEVGGQLADYHFQEHVVSDTTYFEENGPKLGLTVTGTQALGLGFFGTVDFRFAYGNTDANVPSCCKRKGYNDYLWDIRALAGRDFTASNDLYGIAPYIGFGYLNIYKDMRGSFSNGAQGDRGDVEYYYMPIGITPRVRLGENARVSTTLEYDYLVYGRQTNYHNDATISVPDLGYDFTQGYGLRGNVMYERAHWSVGPFFDYWNVDRSPSVTYSCAPYLCAHYMPHSQTLEYGLQARYRF